MNLNDIEECRKALSEIASLLEDGQEGFYATELCRVLSETEQEFEKFLASNELWGGSGSLADSAFSFNPDHPDWRQRRGVFESLMIKLGRVQIAASWTNVRTRMWVETFEKWQRAGLC